MPPSPHVIKHNQSQRPLPPPFCVYVIYAQPLSENFQKSSNGCIKLLNGCSECSEIFLDFPIDKVYGKVYFLILWGVSLVTFFD